MSPGRALLAALVTGAGLGLIYDFLRPLRHRFTAPADLMFVAALLAAWVQLHFGVLQGDVRFATTVAILAGVLVWEATAGKLLSRIFGWFWNTVAAFFGVLSRPFRMFFEKTGIFIKKVFAYLKKKGTMKTIKPPSRKKQNGGRSNERKEKHIPS